jgi:hypothetical protein
MDCLSTLALERLEAGALGGPALSRAQSHLEACPRCSQRSQAMLRQVWAYRGSGSAVLARTRFERVARRQKWVWTLSAVAVLLAAIGVPASLQSHAPPLAARTRWVAASYAPATAPPAPVPVVVAQRKPMPASAGPPVRPAQPEHSDDDEFERTFGYLPPPPGSGGDLREEVSQGDILATVVSQKPRIIECVNHQKVREPDRHGTLVMRWVIAPSGRTQDVTVDTPELRDTPVARCMTDLVQSWTFPKHTQPQDPISFPFRF